MKYSNQLHVTSHTIAFLKQHFPGIHPRDRLVSYGKILVLLCTHAYGN